MRGSKALLPLTFIALAVFGCTAESDPATTDALDSSSAGPEMLEILGTWVETYDGGMTEHVVDELTWAQRSEFGNLAFHIASYDNERRVVTAQNDDANEFSPGLWSKFQWTWDGDAALWYCQVAFDAATELAADATADADPSDPSNSGCGGFGWSALQLAER